MRFKLAILNVLAKRPDGRATLDEVRHEVGIRVASSAHSEQLKRFSALGDIDIFRSGLVLRDGAALQITEAGLSLLDSLASNGALSDPPLSQPTKEPAISDSRLQALDNEDQAGNEGGHYSPAQDEQTKTISTKVDDAASQISADHIVKVTDWAGRERDQKLFGLASLIGFVAAKSRAFLAVARRHFAQTNSVASKNRRNDHLVRSIAGAAFALLSSVVVVACVVAAIAFGQIQSLKSDIAVLRRELLSVKEHVATLEQIEKARQDLDQEGEAQNKADREKNTPDGNSGAEQAALNLSREEIQLIRDYIKAAPSVGMAAPAINVGDPIGGATIPLPSPLTEKVPKLIGASFTTRNGSIIISTRHSRRADAVLAPN